MSEPILVNAAGRTVWFAASDEGGVYRPVTREGRRAFALAAIWVILAGTAGLVGFAVTWEPWCLVGMFVIEAVGLALFARAVIRHS